MELPQYLDYEKIQSMDPYAQVLAGRQMDLARTFQQEKLAGEQEEVKRRQLANIFSEQNNPQKIEEQRLKNLESQYGLPAKRVAGEIAEKTGPQQMQAAIQEWAGKVSQGELDSMYREAQRMARTGKTPQERQAGVDLMQMHPEFVKLKTQHQQRMEEAKFREGEATKRTGMTIAGQKERAAATAASKKSQAATLFDAVRTGKVSPDRALALYQQEEVLADTPEEKALFRDLSARMQTIINNREAAKSQGKVDIGGMGMETRPAPQPYVGTAPPQGQAATPDIESLVKQQGGTYNPQKFEYRINPQTGKVQSRPKG